MSERSPSRWRLLTAQVRSPRADRADLALLPTPDDLGPGWTVVDERTWRTGHQTPDEPWARRAVDAGCVTAWRSLRHDDRWLWAERIVLADEVDVATASASLGARLVPNPRAQVRVLEESRQLPPPAAGATPVFGLRQLTTGAPFVSVTAQTLLWGYAVDRHLLLVCGSGEPAWTPAQLTSVVVGFVARQRSDA